MSETLSQKAEVDYVMHEFKDGALKNSAGSKITTRKQAVEIALREAGVPKK